MPGAAMQSHILCVGILREVFANITLAVDERIAEQARRAASAMARALNQPVRDYLEQLAGAEQLAAELKA